MNLEDNNIKFQNNSDLLQQYFDNCQKEVTGNEVNIQIAGFVLFEFNVPTNYHAIISHDIKLKT